MSAELDRHEQADAANATAASVPDYTHLTTPGCLGVCWSHLAEQKADACGYEEAGVVNDDDKPADFAWLAAQ